MGFVKGGGSFISWISSGSSSGGGGGGTGDIKMFAGVCGQPGGPVNGASTWIPVAPQSLVGTSQVWVILRANVPEQSINSTPDFNFDPGLGEIDITPNIFITDDAVIGWYKPA